MAQIITKCNLSVLVNDQHIFPNGTCTRLYLLMEVLTGIRIVAHVIFASSNLCVRTHMYLHY